MGKRMNGLTLDLFLQIMYISMGSAIAIKIVQKIRDMGKITVIELTPFHLKVLRKKVIEGNKIQVAKDKYAEFPPSAKTEEKKPFWKFWRNPKQYLFLNGITGKIINWTRPKGRPTKKGDLTEEEYAKKVKRFELKSSWTDPEIREHLKKIGTKARQPKTRGENLLPIITLILLMLITMLVYLGFHNIGAL